LIEPLDLCLCRAAVLVWPLFNLCHGIPRP
jgi:hypothetical protein